MLLHNPKQQVKEIAARVRALRLELAWSQKELAARAGVSFGTYQLFERTGKISLERLFRIAVALNRGQEFDSLFQPRPIRDIDDLIPKPTRKHGRTSR
jgi:transcriptional regulator with XRE-family HTH domain